MLPRRSVVVVSNPGRDGVKDNIFALHVPVLDHFVLMACLALAEYIRYHGMYGFYIRSAVGEKRTLLMAVSNSTCDPYRR